MRETWVLLIYTVPAEPSRKRATVWREVKKVGAVYLRDGVCVLPERPELSKAFEQITAKVRDLGGQATMVRGAHLDDERSGVIVAAATAAREAEYQDILKEARRFRAHLQRERDHREFTFGELQELEADVAKLQRWSEQVKQRDFVGLATATEVDAVLAQCDGDLGSFSEEAYAQKAHDL